MRKITELQRTLLKLINDAGGSYCPDADLDPMAVRALHELVKAKRLTIEPNDGAPPRYRLTAYAREELNG